MTARKEASTGQPLLAVCESPVVHAFDDFIRVDEAAAILGRADDAAWRVRHGVTTRHNFTGWSCELPVAADPVMTAVAARVYAAVGLREAPGPSLRFRRYGPGEYHPRHFDAYALGDRLLVATAMVCLMAPEAGGETVFPASALRLAPRVGRLLVWRNVLPDGREDPAALHESLPVLAGTKATLTAFIYQSGWCSR